MNNEEIQGVTADDMTVAELKVLCEVEGLDIKGLTTKADILKVVKKWEKKLVKESKKAVAERGTETISHPQASRKPEVLEFYEGKKVTGKVTLTDPDGRKVQDITVEGGVTYRVAI